MNRLAGIAYFLALEYDYCPGREEDVDTLKVYVPHDVSTKDIEDAVTQYEGMRSDEIARSLAFSALKMEV